MIERPHSHNPEFANETAGRYLANLGLTWSKLHRKKVLDIGALNAEFESAARRHGVDVISIDKEVIEGDYMPPRDSRFVIAHATKLPFESESFDYAVAHMSIMNYPVEQSYQQKDSDAYIEDVLRESCRVLKLGGQFRFTGGDLNDERSIEEIAKHVGFRDVQRVMYPDTHPEKQEYLLSHYYIATK